MSARARLLALVDKLALGRTLVLGDMVADEYIFGAPLKLSREAPVLVLRRNASRVALGGALNPAANAAALGAEVHLAGVIGADATGRELRALLERQGIATGGLFVEEGRPTSTKTRILAGNTQLVQQQIVRIDQIDDSDLQPETERRIIAYLSETIPRMDALIISDYENGVISEAVLDAALPLARALGKVVVADSHAHLERFSGVTALTPNQPEAEAMLGWEITNPARLDRAGAKLLERTEAEAVLLTRGSDGMSLFTRDAEPYHIPASNLTEVADPTGAGDTVAATFALALAATHSAPEVEGARRYRDAALLADLAAGLVVRHVGCATNSPSDLKAAVRAMDGEPVA